MSIVPGRTAVHNPAAIGKKRISAFLSLAEKNRKQQSIYQKQRILQAFHCQLQLQERLLENRLRTCDIDTLKSFAAFAEN